MRQNHSDLLAGINPAKFVRVNSIYRCLLAWMVLMTGGLLPSPAVCAQDLVLDFAVALGGTDEDIGSGIALDAMGNSYIAGHFKGMVDFDPGANLFELTSVGASDIFVCKLDNLGEFQWAVSAGAGSEDRGASISIDDDGGVYLTGRFSGTVDFDPGPNTYSLMSSGTQSAFVWKLLSSGELQWAVALNSTDSVAGVAVSVDDLNRVYCSGSFAGSADFDPGPNTYSLTSAGYGDAFVCALDASGSFLWARALGGDSSDSAPGIAVDSMRGVYISGWFQHTVDFDPGPGEYNLTANSMNLFICKYDLNGQFQWVRTVDGSGNDWCREVSIDSAGKVYGTGYFSASADFDPGPETVILNNAGSADGFIWKLDPSGELDWARSISGTSDDYAYDIACGPSGVYCVGEFRGTVDFDPGPSEFTLESAGDSDVFICVMDDSGQFRWAGAAGGDSTDVGLSIAASSMGEVYATGRFSTSGDFDPGPEILSISTLGDSDAFVLKLHSKSIPIAVDDSGETESDRSLVELSNSAINSVLANDIDANSLDVLTVTAYDATSVLGAVVVVNADGTFLYDPTAVGSLQSLATGASRVDSFTYTVSDGTDTDIGTVTITVYGPGTKLPAATIWGVGFLCLALAGAGVRACRLR